MFNRNNRTIARNPKTVDGSRQQTSSNRGSAVAEDRTTAHDDELSSEADMDVVPFDDVLDGADVDAAYTRAVIEYLRSCKLHVGEDAGGLFVPYCEFKTQIKSLRSGFRFHLRCVDIEVQAADAAEKEDGKEADKD